MPVKDYVKIECVRCGRQMASCSKKPKCSSCQGTKFKTIEQFKPEMMIQKHNATPQTKKPIESPKQRIETTTTPPEEQKVQTKSLDDEFFGVED